jgi:beta-phosphoglucomutase
MIKAILFDMDGVLIDARKWHYDALNLALSHFGITISEESHLATFDGLPTREKLRILSKAKKLPNGLHELINNLKQIYTLEICNQRCKPKFNHQYALSRLKKEGYKLAVCSNSVRVSIETMMNLSCLNSYLDLIVSNQDVKEAKPNPEMYQQAMSMMGCAPGECLILEDNENGIKAAVAAGGHLFKVGVPDDVTYQSIKSRIHEIETA